MEKHFILYPEAMSLKELGFIEGCFGYFEIKTEKLSISDLANNYKWLTDKVILAPTWDQAFEFFRVKYKFDISIEDNLLEDDDENEIIMWDFFIYKTGQQSDNKKMKFCSNNEKTFIDSYTRDEARINCLKKLIEIVNT